MSIEPIARTRFPLAGAVVVRGAAFAFLWWAFVEGDAKGWWVGLIGVAVALAVSLALVPPMQAMVRPFAALRFGAYFVHQSFLGGVDVARRAFDPRSPIDPGVFECELRYPAGAIPVLVADTLSLLPGTVGAGFHDGKLVVHVLDRNLPLHERLDTLEARIDGMFSDRHGAPGGR